MSELRLHHAILTVLSSVPWILAEGPGPHFRPDAPSLSEPCWRCAFSSSASGWIVSNHVSNYVSGPISWLDSPGGLWTQLSVLICLGQTVQPVTLPCSQLSGLCWWPGITHGFHLILPPMWMGPTHWHLNYNYYFSILELKHVQYFKYIV